MKEKIPGLRDVLETALGYLDAGDQEKAILILKNTADSLRREEVVRNTALIDRLYQFVERVTSDTKDKTPEEVVILPAVIEMLLTRMGHDR